MGEHLPCKQGVKSSNLSVSIGYHMISGPGKDRGWYLENCISKKSIAEMQSSDIRKIPGDRDRSIQKLNDNQSKRNNEPAL